MKIRIIILTAIILHAAGNSFAGAANFSSGAHSPTGINAPAAVSSINRVSFYTGRSFELTLSGANLLDFLGLEKDKVLTTLVPELKALYAMLKGKPEAEEFLNVFKMFQKSGDLTKFKTDTAKVREKYRAGLAAEQKWYFETGEFAGKLQYSLSRKTNLDFIYIDMDAPKLIKSAPAAAPPEILTALKQLLPIAAAMEKSGINVDEKTYAAAASQVKQILDSIGRITAADKQ